MREPNLENFADALHAVVDALEVGINARLGFSRLNEQNRVGHFWNLDRTQTNSTVRPNSRSS